MPSLNPRLTHGDGSQTSVFWFFLCFTFCSTPLALLLDPTECTPRHPVSHFWQIYNAWRQSSWLRRPRTDETNLWLLHPCLKNKKMSELKGGRSWLSTIILESSMFFLAGCQSQNIQAAQCWGWVWVDPGKNSNNNNNHLENELVRPVGWASRLGGPPELVTLWLLLKSLLDLAASSFTFPILFCNSDPKLRAVLSIWPEVSRDVPYSSLQYPKEEEKPKFSLVDSSSEAKKEKC